MNWMKILVTALLVVLNMSYVWAEPISLVRCYPENSRQFTQLMNLPYEIATCVPRPDRVELLVPASEVPGLHQMGLVFEVVHDDFSAHWQAHISSLRQDLGEFHTYDEMLDEMETVQTAFPGITQLISIGQSHFNRDIWAMKISDNVSVDEDEPEMLIIGNHHAVEIMTVEIPLHFIHYLTENYTINDTATYLVDEREIWIVPMLNPDGHHQVAENELFWRKNCRDNNGNGQFDPDQDGVDLNRNYDYLWGYDDLGSSPDPTNSRYRGPAPFSEPEVQTIRDLCETHEFSIALNYHTSGNYVFFPWDYELAFTEDDPTFRDLGHLFAETNAYRVLTAPQIGFTVNGGSDDWMYGEQTTKDKIMAYIIEVGMETPTPEEEIPIHLANTLPINIIAGLYADNPHRIHPPAIPVVTAPAADPDGSYVVSWSTPEPDPNNPALNYELRERTGRENITDSAEDVNNTNWEMSGFSMSEARAYDGQHSYHSGQGYNMVTWMISTDVLEVEADMHLTFQTWYEFESGTEYIDYAYVQVSLDGNEFVNIPGNITTNENPEGNNEGNGITGNSDGWVLADFDLSQYAGQKIFIRFRYWTAPFGTLDEGMYVDDFYPAVYFAATTLLDTALTGDSYPIEDREYDSYYYQVRARDGDDQFSLWSISTKVVVDGVSVNPDEVTLAHIMALSQNYPNPFSNQSTTIPFSLSAPDRIQIKIYNTAGKLIRVLVDDQYPAGNFIVTWNGSDESKQRIAPALYFYRLEKSTFSATKKRVLVK
ncbi:MAG: T9SS type A sorting domain-containing protein [Planctomycetes bacterium]|nr:T9SS type A sorting domain-containing protein [Planctomycetota bacterium]